ncbi:hypothetical protein E2553_39870 [Paraburkholderia dipogonis]|uniref:Uncharacterized protein n=1 Tax=Paraburkholderia dipogonis TaxID=1211383 RepID=A0A4Y8MJL4_9BURK|nr:hypothetical protein E2553_39870 [Paraburkholderia dipogonis]
MECAGRPLRAMVQHWLAPNAASGFKVSHFGRACGDRYVCIVAHNGRWPLAMYFYRHRDRAWYIFPQGPARPAMRSGEWC